MCCLPALTTRRPACASGCSDYPSPSHTYCRPPSGRNPWGTGTWLARLGHPRTTRCDPQLRRRTWHSPCTAHLAAAAACAPCTPHHSRAHSPSAHTCIAQALAPRKHRNTLGTTRYLLQALASRQVPRAIKRRPAE